MSWCQKIRNVVHCICISYRMLAHKTLSNTIMFLFNLSGTFLSKNEHCDDWGSLMDKLSTMRAHVTWCNDGGVLWIVHSFNNVNTQLFLVVSLLTGKIPGGQHRGQDSSLYKYKGRGFINF